MKNILVTGGAGLIGSHLCEVLLNIGYRVICMDFSASDKQENVLHLMSNKNFEILEKDICSPFSIEVDEIYNLASPSPKNYFQYDPVKTVEINVNGMINVLNLAKEKLIKVVQASTSEVYGSVSQDPKVENNWGYINSEDVRSCYYEGKRCAESLCFTYNRQYNVPVKIARFFNIYGEKMGYDDGRVVSNFICQSLKGENITIYGDGKQVRSFCYVDDIVDGMIRFMVSSPDIKGPINFGSKDGITISELADLIIKLTNSNSKIIYNNLSSVESDKRTPDISKAFDLLGWYPRVNLQTGLIKTIEYFKNKMKSN